MGRRARGGAALLIGAVGVLWACGEVAFACADSSQCDSSPGGVCEVTGFCSFPDDGCDSGRRYGAYSGALSEVCVIPGQAEGSSGVASESGSSDSASASDGTTSAGATTLSTSASTTGAVSDSTTSSDSAGSSGGVVECSADWWDCKWLARMQLTPNDDDLQSLEGFPLLVVLNPERVDYSRFSEGGADLRFVSAQGDVLPYEIERWNPDGETPVWVRTDLGEGASFAMYFDNPEASDFSDTEAVWEGFAAVWHMGASPEKDATVNDNDGTSSDVSSETGVVGKSSSYNGTVGFVRMPSSPSLDGLFGGGGTVTMWINVDGAGVSPYPRLMDKSSNGTGSSGFRFALTNAVSGSAQLRFTRDFTTTEGYWNSSGPVVDFGNWQHVALVYDDSSTQPPVMYIDGQPVGVSTESMPAGSSIGDGGHELFIGNSESDDKPWDGRIDEVRVFRGSRSADWIDAEFRAGRDNVLAYGPVESLQ